MSLTVLQVALLSILLLGCYLRPSKQFGRRSLMRTLSPLELYQNLHLVHSMASDDTTVASSTHGSDNSVSGGRGMGMHDQDSSLEASRASLAAIVDRSWKKVTSLIPHACLVKSTDEVKILAFVSSEYI